MGRLRDRRESCYTRASVIVCIDERDLANALAESDPIAQWRWAGEGVRDAGLRAVPGTYPRQARPTIADAAGGGANTNGVPELVSGVNTFIAFPLQLIACEFRKQTRIRRRSLGTPCPSAPHARARDGSGSRSRLPPRAHSSPG